MKTGRLLVALALFAALPQAASAACDVSYRLWQDGNNTYYRYGEIITLEVGEKADLYIHGPQSRSADPYSAAADIGAPTAFGVGGQRPQDISRVLRLGNHDPRKGKISFTTIAAGETALAYRITDLVSPGRLEDVPGNCRTGQVRITVRRAAGGGGGTTRPPTPGVGSGNEAAHALIVQLYEGILRRDAREAEDYPDSFFDQVQREGQRGLISIAETMTSSPEFRDGAIARTRQSLQATGVAAGNLSQAVIADQLLTDICQTLYGTRPDQQIRNLMANKLNGCLSGNANLCRQLGRDLVSQRQYWEHNRSHLSYLPR